ncbi:hypothetical protein [Roseivirga pacifica]|uniref:hypothetical protein n=1 Tax=Roseivirga pacifica TaxID=1267423 RepID=UPI0020963027|nr:hypothetical protein [Roseivirga pacifica]MCO6358189.1 hypothetical protein [Roseivirga pacifica]MCO6366627.1 hypothetical protein [Roseivirga pacifica]MCO6371112.1 hypothetical protein [Roseivirga pacifica]MCO6373920.1 hypothetical protein [Roseivirga pacifica]MCO6380901.1 hypothetical protein [Roseivirga pacifica]
MQITLVAEDKSTVGVCKTDVYGLALKANNKELVTIKPNGVVLVNGKNVEPELIGLAVIQWANKLAEVIEKR